MDTTCEIDKVKSQSGKAHEEPPKTQSSPQTGVSSQPTTTSTTTKSLSPPTSPLRSSTGQRISTGHSSKGGKKREGSSSSADVKSAGSGYVSYVQRVVAEILESERTYIASLKDIIEGYLEPMEKILGSTDAKEDLLCLFGNIREIFKFGW
ncbi:hypothetical protein EGW08_006963 [Elysia chlorotica]|uniref:DH domain-containing protein n=1 Tax=Elysia chlorotica TaxID=188477 RepID=A0A433TUM2_ELYCH|nr:hypothetical protein EGW08_006963 [Elysia chlorotica]